jgi:small subunit ribosomal protein S20
LANHKSAIKRHKQTEKRRVRNASVKTTVKSSIKKVREAITNSDAAEAKSSLVTAISRLDGAVSKGVLHKNNASRKVSRLTTAVNALESK